MEPGSIIVGCLIGGPLMVPTNRKRGIPHEQRKFHMNITKNFTVQVTED